MNKPMEDIEFTIFDTETTGLAPRSGDRIVEIAAVKIKAGKKTGEFQTMVNPGREISQGAFLVNGITPEMLEGAPDMRRVMPGFLDFIKGTCLCAYNASFDMAFLENELSLMSLSPMEGVVVIDMLKMSRKLIPGMERYSLGFVTEKLGIGCKQKHRALSDVELCVELFIKFQDMLEEKGVSDLHGIAGLFGIKADFLEGVNNAKLSCINEAISESCLLKIKYFSSSGAQVTDRHVVPKEVRSEQGRSYLVGYCCLKKEERTFRIDNILQIEKAYGISEA